LEDSCKNLGNVPEQGSGQSAIAHLGQGVFKAAILLIYIGKEKDFTILDQYRAVSDQDG
jgi:predicted nucleic acid-binding Zn finger protein